MFESSMQDPRYLPFEGAGLAEAKFKLRIDGENIPRSSIADVILTIRYTARDAGRSLT